MDAAGNFRHAHLRLDLLHRDAELVQNQTEKQIEKQIEKQGTPTGVDGVEPFVPSAEVPAAQLRSTLRPMHFVWLFLACVSLLGQGERCRVDPRFRSPSSTLHTYWSALRHDDGDTAFECFVEGRHDLPEPGALWFLPPTDELWLQGFHSLPVTAGRVMVSYEVHYRPKGVFEERMFKTGSELVRLRGEWRIAQPLGNASWPEWKPVPTPVDI